MQALPPRKHAHTFGSIVGMESRIEGKLLVDESVRIDGTIVGRVQQQTGKERWLIVGVKAEIHGDIRTQNASLVARNDDS